MSEVAWAVAGIFGGVLVMVGMYGLTHRGRGGRDLKRKRSRGPEA